MKRAVVAAVLAAVIGAGALPASGAQLGHRISEDTTWTRAQSPVVFDDYVEIDRGVTLTIEPGVRVETVGIEIEGALRAVGTESEAIVFTGVDGTLWDGMGFYDEAAPASVIQHARVEGARYGISMHANAFPVHDTVFTGNEVALKVDNPDANLTFTGNELYSNETAFQGRTTGFIGLYGNDFWDNETSLFFEAQSPWACGSGGGIFDVRYNDILRGPDAPWFSFDVRASDESGSSGMVLRATDNWWGTVDEDDIRARLEPAINCCPPPDRAVVAWRDPALVPQTPAEPPGPVGAPDREPSGHGDPAYDVEVKTPDDHGCLRYGTVERIKGTVRADRLRVALARKLRESCRWYDPATGRFSDHQACDRPAWFGVRVASSGRWRVALPRPLSGGRYVFFGGDMPGGELVRFRVLPR